MNTHVTRLDIVSSNTEPAHSYAFRMRGSVIVAIAVFVVLVLGMAIWMQSVADIDMEAVSAAHSALWGIDGSPNTEYFPAQYQNQATEIPEHIQAF